MSVIEIVMPYRVPWGVFSILIGLGIFFMAKAFWITWGERADS